MLTKRFFFLLVFVALFSNYIFAQRDVGTFVGTAYDEEKEALPGVSIVAKNMQTGLTQSTVTNMQGRYRLERLPRGVYSLIASLQGFSTLIKEKIELFAGAEIKIDFVLKMGTLEEEITVIGENPMVETTRSQISTVISNKEIMSLPQSNRNFLGLVYYAPGTLPDARTTSESGFSVNGMRGESNNFMLDGVDNNDLTDNAYKFVNLPPEAIEEFRLISNNFSAEYGRNSGGIINVVMKSGTNEFGGSAWMFYRGDSEFFRTADWLTKTRPPYNRSQYGFTLGGPIIKDKTFFYANFEGIFQQIDSVNPVFLFTPQAIARAQGASKVFFNKYGSNYPEATYGFVDVDKDGFPDYGRANFQQSSDYESYIGALKIDHNFSSKDRISFRWIYNYVSNSDSNIALPGTSIDVPNHRHTGGITWLHIFSGKVFNELRLGFHQDRLERADVDREMPHFVFNDGVTALGSGGSRTLQNNVNFQIADVLNIQKGNHNIKVGGELRYWNVESASDSRVLGRYNYLTGMDFILNKSAATMLFYADPPDPDPLNPYVPGNPFGEWKTGFGLSDRKWRGYEIGLFVQDDWRLSDRLTLSGGLRWEFYSVPKEVSGKGINQPAFGTKEGYEARKIIEGEYGVEGIRYLIFDGRELLNEGLWNPYYLAFAPKISFAYDLTGDGKTSLRGGFGITYDRMINRTYENDRFNYPDMTFATFYGERYGFPAIYASIPGTLPSDNISINTIKTSLRWMVPDMKPQRAYNWLLGIQKELWPNVSIEIDYTGTAGRDVGNIHQPNRFTGDGLDGVYDGINPYVSILDTNTRENRGKSNYHALWVILNKRFSNGWSWYSSYTFGVVKDQSAIYQAGQAVSHERLDMEYSYADFDHRHRVVGGFVYELPFFRQAKSSIVRSVLGGWQIAGTFHYTSARRFSIQGTALSTDWNLDGFSLDRPLWNGGSYQDIIKWTSDDFPYLDKSMLGKPNPPKSANDLSYYDQKFLPRNAFTWFPTYNMDVAAQKTFTMAIGSRDISVQLIGEVFNLFNSTFWALEGPWPGYGSQVMLSYESTAFGKVTRKDGFRASQISIRVLF